jgi:hypothetical protein
MYTPVGSVDDGTTSLAYGASSPGSGGAVGGGAATGGGGGNGVHPYANYAVIAWFLIAAAGLMLLDRGGFRFVVTSGKR